MLLQLLTGMLSEGVLVPPRPRRPDHAEAVRKLAGSRQLRQCGEEEPVHEITCRAEDDEPPDHAANSRAGVMVT